ncbi:MAG: hypothetical protein ACI81O_000687 [Cyclobacteriaceae bacterium]
MQDGKKIEEKLRKESRFNVSIAGKYKLTLD